MEILVCIKQVPGTSAVEVDPVTGVLRRDGVESKLNPYDLYALELAFQLRQKYGGRVRTITMGPPQAKAAVLEALYMGADGGAVISDRRFAGADVLATSYTLAQGLRSLAPFDLILCGKQTTDGDTAQVGPEIAEHLGYPQVTYGLEAEVDGDTVKVKKEVEEGVEVIGVKMPCLLTFTKPAWDPRYPTIKRKMAANRAEIPTLTAADLPTIDLTQAGLKGSPTKVKKTFVPQKKSGGVKIKEETAEDSAKKLFQLLSDASII